ncbi:unnamed protein product [Brachionus calyciflorus]|uniref:Uncharacterized protein n=1 Tax=Brachionus calyciflorus TaxID=104777 RepID=A0A814RZX2_9BILA|nr:unnamed protein product [Brachionus calyciflorus]
MNLFTHSIECAKSELDLFMTPSTNSSIVSGGWFEINPTSSLSVAILLIRKAQINPSVMLGHALALEKTTAVYIIKRIVVKQHTIGQRISSQVISNISSKSLPSRVVIGFVKNSA